MKRFSLACASVAALAFFATPGYAQWSYNAASNLAVGFGSGDQVQPKIVRAPDGGAWISWFDNGGQGGYSVYLQRLDSVGNPMLGRKGILVATRGFSSTTDYALSVDSKGDALLAFRTDQYGGVKIEAQVVSPAGKLLWGTDGREFGNGSDFVANPKITATDGGQIVVGWTDNANMQLARLDASGTELWNPEVVISDPNGASLTLSDLHASTNGGTILSYVSSSGFSGPKYLYALKLDSSGNTIWTTPVYDGGSLQFGNFPTFTPDGLGGGVFAWYDSGALQSHVQHILANGEQVFPHNGVLVSTSSSDIEVDPQAAYNPKTGNIFVFWEQQDSLQSEAGVAGQRISPAGNRMWGADGVTIVPLASNGSYEVSTVDAPGNGAVVFYSGGTTFGQDTIGAARLDSAGSYVWSSDTVGVSTTVAQKFRLASTVTNEGMPILAWEDTGTGDSNILAQNLRYDGTLGPRCPAGYGRIKGSATPGERVLAFAYQTAGGGQSAILLSPPGFNLIGASYSQADGLKTRIAYPANELDYTASAGWVGWYVKARQGSAGGAYTLCLNRS